MPVACFGDLDLSHLIKCSHDDTFVEFIILAFKLSYVLANAQCSCLKDMGSNRQGGISDSTAYRPY